MGHTAALYTYLIGKEVDWGTEAPAGIDIDVGIVRDIRGGGTRELIESMGISDVEVNSNNVGMQEGTHTVEMEYQHGRIFEFVIGEASHALSSPDTTHTFHPVDNAPKSYSTSYGSNLSGGDVGQKALGNMIESCTIRCALNELLTVTFTARGKFPSKLTTVPAHTVSSLQVFTYDLTTIEFNSVASTLFQDFEITITKTLANQDGIGSLDHQGIALGKFVVTFKGTVLFDDDTYHTHIIDNDVTSVEMNTTNGLAAGAGKRALEIALNDIEITKFEEAGRAGELVAIEVEGSGKINTFTSTDNIAEAAWLPTS